VFELKPDYEECKRRYDAFWEREIIDRPLVTFNLVKPEAELVPLPESRHASSEECWLDTEYQVAHAVARLTNRVYLGDTMPIAFPDLGPEVFSSFYGCPIHFGDYGTSWTDPIIDDWSEAGAVRLDWDSPYMHKLHEMTDGLLEAGAGRFITGMADWHPGGDHVAALRDPQQLAMDLLTHPDQVKRLLAQAEADYFAVYDVFYEKLRGAGLPVTTWLPLLSDTRYYVPSNDFSIIISRSMFEEFFLPGIANECRFLDHSIYHLDGPGALRHLDAILAIPELDALQWVPGAGNEGFSRWIWVYQRAQAAGKGIQVFCTFDDCDAIIKSLAPKGLFLTVTKVPNMEAAVEMLARLGNWSARFYD